MTHGAYVAKPAEATTPPDVPPSWDPDWTYPGPDPPGYNVDDGKDYRLTLEVGDPGYVTPDDPECAVLAKLLEGAGLFNSINIDSSSFIVWTATISSVDVLISPLTNIVLYLLGYGAYGAQPNMVFAITNDDIGSDVIVNATGYIRRNGSAGEEYVTVMATDTIEIPVLNRYKLVLEVGDPEEIDVDNPFCYVKAVITKQDGSTADDIDATSYVSWSASVSESPRTTTPSQSTVEWLNVEETYGANPNIYFGVTETDKENDAIVSATAYIVRDGEYVETISEEETIAIPVVGDDPIISFEATLTVDSVTQTGYTPWYTDIELMVRKGFGTAKSWAEIIFNPQATYIPTTISSTWDEGGGAGATMETSPADPGARVLTAEVSSPDDTKTYRVYYHIGSGHSVVDFSFTVTLEYTAYHESGATTTNTYSNTYSSGTATKYVTLDIDTGLVSDTF